MTYLDKEAAIKCGDLPKDHKQDYKEITLEQATNPTFIKLYYEQFKKEFNRPSVFEKNNGQK